MADERKPAWWTPARWRAFTPFKRVAGGVTPAGDREQQACANAVALYAAGRPADAERVLADALAASPASQTLYENLGAVRLLRGDAPQALAHLQRARSIGAVRPEVLNLLGLCHLITGTQDEALSLLADAATLDPQFALAQANAGWVNIVSGNVPASSRYLRNWLRLKLPSTDPPVMASPGRRMLSNITLCCIDCAYHDLAINALRRSIAQCEFEAVCYFTDRDMELEGIRSIRIDPLKSAEDYSNFVIHRLPDYIETDFVLIVQYDGFVLNADAWSDDFLNYDYIGAKILLSDGYVVGNGGFSLRSRKLLKALGKSAAAGYDAKNSPWQEDMAICVQFREHLELAHNITFAPGDLAERFASGTGMPDRGTFGFHNLMQLVKLVENDYRADAPRGTRGMSISLRAETPFGPFSMTTNVELRGTAEFDRKVRAHRRTVKPADAN
jgi:hypothetical protein